MLPISVPIELELRVRNLAKKKGKNVSATVREMIEAAIDQYEDAPDKFVLTESHNDD